MQPTLFESRRAQMSDSIADALASLNAYMPRYRVLVVAFSGGKDSTAALTFLLWAIEAKKVPRPEVIVVLYSDTRLELPPLHESAMRLLDDAAERGCVVQVVRAPVEHRLLVYWLGQGVPAPNNRMRWCTDKIKVQPIDSAIRALAAERYADLGKPLLLTGVRVGESAARDDRISLSCSRDGAECGQGWFQTALPDELCDKLAPMLRWRVCHVWEWLRHWAPQTEFGDFDTSLVADAYGGDEAEEIAARTGCTGCPVAAEDRGLLTVLRNPLWGYLRPLTELRPLFWRMREARYRLRQPAGEQRKDGSLVKNQQRLGPMTLAARAEALAAVLDIERRVNEAAAVQGRPRISLLDEEELTAIQTYWRDRPWPDGWTGTEPHGDVDRDLHYGNGHVQPRLRILGDAS